MADFTLDNVGQCLTLNLGHRFLRPTNSRQLTVFSAHFGALWTMRTIGDVWPDLSEIVCERLFSANLDEWAKEK